ncbi:MAG: hypothetical protein ABW063_00540 [Caulobacter sp.]
MKTRIVILTLAVLLTACANVRPGQIQNHDGPAPGDRPAGAR